VFFKKSTVAARDRAPGSIIQYGLFIFSLSSHAESTVGEKGRGAVEEMGHHHLDDHLDHFGKEGGSAAETLHAIAGGLQVGPFDCLPYLRFLTSAQWPLFHEKGKEPSWLIFNVIGQGEKYLSALLLSLHRIEDILSTYVIQYVHKQALHMCSKHYDLCALKKSILW
jgi:hypothetical protein